MTEAVETTTTTEATATTTEETQEVTSTETSEASTTDNPQETTDTNSTEVTTEENTETTTEETQEGTSEEAKGVDFEKYGAEITEKGELSEDSYKELADQGFDKEMVDAYIRGATQVISQDDADSLIEKHGGQETFDTIKTWAAKNLSQDELDTFNGALQTKSSADMAITWLSEKYKAAEGFDPTKRLEGNPSGTPKGDVYKDKAEMMKDIRDPRYRQNKDAAFVKMVEAKIARSKLLGKAR